MFPKFFSNFFQAEDGIRDSVASRGLGDVYKRQANTGAYGMSLSSNYNTRPTIAEILVTGSKHKLIKKRQSLENLVNN